jgi:hypothetical protein
LTLFSDAVFQYPFSDAMSWCRISEAVF